jgi:hypothetical protein
MLAALDLGLPGVGIPLVLRPPGAGIPLNLGVIARAVGVCGGWDMSQNCFAFVCSLWQVFCCLDATQFSQCHIEIGIHRK